jgi:GNAT superfamily N-acetyltransferase
MSFWSKLPGPTWWDCIESFNPCVPTVYGLCSDLTTFPRNDFGLPVGVNMTQLLPRHAKEIEKLLREDFSLYPRCRISLSAERISEGFFLDEWIGVGAFTLDKKLIGCCISKPLGRLKLPTEVLNNTGIVDYFCVKESYRKQGLASKLLEELVSLTRNRGRSVHIFLKEGFPLLKLPPLYTSQYLAREREVPGEYKEYFESMGIGIHGLVQSYTHADYLPLTKFVANLPWQLSGDSELFRFTFHGHTVFLCMTDLHHRTVPDGKKIGELCWILPQTAEVPLSIQKLAVETCVDSNRFDIILLDKTIPHDSRQRWKKDAGFSWYIFNYKPGNFFTTKPFWIV